MPVSSGKAARRSSNASRPPADAPTPTIELGPGLLTGDGCADFACFVAGWMAGWVRASLFELFLTCDRRVFEARFFFGAILDLQAGPIILVLRVLDRLLWSV